MVFPQLNDCPSGVGCFFGGDCYAQEKEAQPSLPVTLVSDSHEAIVVFLSTMFQKGAQIEQWSVQHSLVNQQKGDQESTNPTIAIQKRMNRFELNVRYAAVDERGQIPALMQEMLEVVQGMVHVRDRWRNESRSLQGCVSRSDPVLGRAKRSRRFFRSPATLQEFTMDLPDQAKRKRERREPGKSVIHGSDVVDHFLDIVGDVLDLRVQLEREDILKRALRSLDLRTVDRFPSNVHRYEQVRIGQGVRHTVQSSDCLVGSGEETNDRIVELDGRVKRERTRENRRVA